MDSIFQDLRYAMRTLRRHRGFVALSLASTALAIGATTIVFSVVYALNFRPLPFREPARVMELMETTDASCPACFDTFSRDTWTVWQAATSSYADVAEVRGVPLQVRWAENTVGVEGAAVGGAFFRLLGVRPLHGRVWSADETAMGAAVVLSYDLWRQHFLSDSGVVGRSVAIEGQLYAITAVMPQAFTYPEGARLWLPEGGGFPRPRPDERVYSAIGRLREGVSVERAQDELRRIASRTAEVPGQTNGARGTRGATVQPLGDRIRAARGNVVWLLAVGVSVTFLISCVNLANLFLVRALTRAREVAVRVALGAQPGRIARQLVTESLLLTSAGGAVGLALAAGGLGTLRPVVQRFAGPVGELHVDGRALAFAVMLTLITGTVFGLAPAALVTRVNVQQTLRNASVSIAGGRAWARLRGVFVVSEVGCALALAAFAGVLIRSFAYTQRVDLGFDARRLIVAEVGGRAASPEQSAQLLTKGLELAARLERLKSVETGAVWSARRTRIGLKPGEPPATADHGRTLPYSAYPIESFDVTPTFFRTTGLSLRRGRLFSADDNAGAEPVTLINEIAARRLWPGESALGRRLKLGGPDSPHPWATIVGVVSDSYPIDEAALFIAMKSSEVWPLMFRPLAQTAPTTLIVAVRQPPNGAAAAVALQREIQGVFPGEGTPRVVSLRDLMDGTSNFARVRLSSQLLTLLSLVTVALSMLGVYGVVANSVRDRTGEIGIRTALGASRSHVVLLVMREAMLYGALGMVLGGGAALFAVRSVRPLLYGPTPLSPLVLVATGAGVLALLGVACAVPARQAAMIPPLEALRASR